VVLSPPISSNVGQNYAVIAQGWAHRSLLRSVTVFFSHIFISLTIRTRHDSESYRSNFIIA
jgi:hypothetical protein